MDVGHCHAGSGLGHLPVLVIAIRGSASKLGHVVNANERPKAAGHFIVWG